MQSPHSEATTGNCNGNATVNASSKTPLEQKRCLQVANSDADVVFFLRWLPLQISAYHMLSELMDGHKWLQSKTIGFNYKNVPLPIRPRSATEPYRDATEYARERCQYLIDSVVDGFTRHHRHHYILYSLLHFPSQKSSWNRCETQKNFAQNVASNWSGRNETELTAKLEISCRNGINESRPSSANRLQPGFLIFP